MNYLPRPGILFTHHDESIRLWRQAFLAAAKLPAIQ
jgi:hypothetical protein